MAERRYDQKVEAAGGVVYRIKDAEAEVVVIFRRGVWDLPKGKLDPGEKLEQCAAREVAEETGVAFPTIKQRLTETIHYYEEDGKTIKKHTTWFAMVTQSDNATPQHEEQIEEVRWVALDEAIKIVGFENLQKVLDEFRFWLQNLE